MNDNFLIAEYRYMDDYIKKNRENSLKDFLINHDDSNINFYDLNMYKPSDDFYCRVLSEVNRSVINKEIVLNRYQIEILNILRSNNLFLSAPTSFGKTFLMLEFIKRNKRDLNNIIFIIPTLALMNELLKKIYNLFSDEYNICINASEEFKAKNIFVFVPERSDKDFLEKIKDIKVDFLVFDEIYKLQALKQSEIKTDDRLIYMNKVYLELINKAEKIALLGPYINNVNFGKTKLDIVKYYTNYLPVYNKIKILEEGEDWTRYIKLNHQLIYFSTPGSIYKNINKIIEQIPEDQECMQIYEKEIKYLEQAISKDWYVVDLLKRGIGIHHGKTPMFLRKFYENEYNNGRIKVLLCTNTLMEGINTPTDSLIIVDDPGSAFKLNNLIGRVGRLNVKNPTIGEIIVTSSSIIDNITNTNGWFDLKILAEEDEIVTDDEIIYLNKKYEDEKKQESLNNRLELLEKHNISVETIVNNNLQLKKAYDYINNNIYAQLANVSDMNEFVKIGLSLIKGPSYLFKIEKYEALNYSYRYLPYTFYLGYLLLGISYKHIVDKFNNTLNVKHNLSNINVFIDSLYELNNFIKFKFSKLIQYIELYETPEMKNNKNLQKFIGILAGYKSFDTAYKILDDLGINEEDSKKILEFLGITNVTSTSYIIRLIRINREFLIKQDLTPFTINNIMNI